MTFTSQWSDRDLRTAARLSAAVYDEVAGQTRSFQDGTPPPYDTPQKNVDAHLSVCGPTEDLLDYFLADALRVWISRSGVRTGATTVIASLGCTTHCCQLDPNGSNYFETFITLKYFLKTF